MWRVCDCVCVRVCLSATKTNRFFSVSLGIVALVGFGKVKKEIEHT